MRGELKTISVLLVLALLINIFAPTMKVIANSAYDVTFQAESGHTVEKASDGHLKIDGKYVDLKNGNDTIGEVSVSGNIATIRVEDGTAGELNYNAEKQFTLYNTNGHTKYEMGSTISANTVFLVEDYDEGGNSQETSGGNSESADYSDEIHLIATFNKASGEVLINGKRATGDAGEIAFFDGILEKIGYNEASQKNEITINTAFGENIAGKITINNVEYSTNGTDSNTYEVAGAESYTIVIDGVEDENPPRTIIWANPGATDIDAEDAQIEHGSAKIIAVYDADGNLVNKNDYTHPGQDGGLDNGNGWANVKPGDKVVFEFTPEYGYQLTKVAANEQALAPQVTTNQYTFIMPNTNVHFAATFTKTEDIVKAESEKVEAGTINLGSALEGGSVQLSVSDVELSADKIKGFEAAADGYTVSNYLDIDLYNVFYKGKADSEDVWSNKISELDKEATISLKLADGITADDIVIVHNIHDGEEYEVIKIDSYDAETNTITFKTKSFSNYAIATKTASTTEETKTTETSSNPKTGDNIIMMISIFVIALFGAFTTIKVNNHKTRKH